MSRFPWPICNSWNRCGRLWNSEAAALEHIQDHVDMEREKSRCRYDCNFRLPLSPFSPLFPPFLHIWLLLLVIVVLIAHLIYPNTQCPNPVPGLPFCATSVLPALTTTIGMQLDWVPEQDRNVTESIERAPYQNVGVCAWCLSLASSSRLHRLSRLSRLSPSLTKLAHFCISFIGC